MRGYRIGMSKVYFIGAGATKAVKNSAPLNKELIKYIFTSLNHPQSQKHIDILEHFIESFFYKNQYQIYPNIEDVLSLLDYNISLKSYSAKGYSCEKFKLVRNCLVILIALVLKESLTNLDSDLTDEFCNKLPQGSTIISTNYDIVMDNSLYINLGSVNYGIDIRSDIFPRTNSVEKDLVFRHQLPQLNKGSIRLLKLHGSLNWFYCERCDELDISVGEKGIVDYLKDDSSDLKCVTYPRCTCRYMPLIVTPTYLKSYKNRIFEKIWIESEKSISEANELIFIGYSLSLSDTLIKCMLSNGLAKNTKRPKITVVDKLDGSTAETNFISFFGDVDYQPIGLQAYVENME